MKILILAGGAGIRLWPLSRTYFPKQFLKIKENDMSIFQKTFQRSLQLADLSDVFVVTNVDHKFLVLGQIEELGYKIDEMNILIEPQGKNTLPAICYGVKEIQKKGDSIVAVFPSDHLIDADLDFINTIKQGIELANKYIVIFGVRPSIPHTGYGYIKASSIAVENGYVVDEFKEKPDDEMAQYYFEKGYLWNSGMFMFKTNLFINEVEKHCPEVLMVFQGDDLISAYNEIPQISIDYGLMEKSKNIAVIPFTARWSDLGSFDSLYNEYSNNDHENVTFNNKDILIDSSGNFLYTDKSKAVALIGANDLIVVDEKDALLICKKDQSQRVKEVVQKLKSENDIRADYHLTSYRPWGSYTILEEGKFYKIKRITVLPGKQLSYQLHHHRSEHWVVVNGTAKVTVEGDQYLVRSGESTFVKAGQKHRLENPGRLS